MMRVTRKIPANELIHFSKIPFGHVFETVDGGLYFPAANDDGKRMGFDITSGGLVDIHEDTLGRRHSAELILK